MLVIGWGFWLGLRNNCNLNGSPYIIDGYNCQYGNFHAMHERICFTAACKCNNHLWWIIQQEVKSYLSAWEEPFTDLPRCNASLFFKHDNKAEWVNEKVQCLLSNENGHSSLDAFCTFPWHIGGGVKEVIFFFLWRGTEGPLCIQQIRLNTPWFYLINFDRTLFVVWLSGALPLSQFLAYTLNFNVTPTFLLQR